MKVILFAFEFPPMAGSGIRRTMNLARFLPEHGITPVVVTTDEASYRRLGYKIEPQLLKQLPPELEVHRIPISEGARSPSTPLQIWSQSYFSYSGGRCGQFWKENITREMPSLLETIKPNAVSVTIPPYSIGPLFCEMKSLGSIPLVMDFRDPWSESSTVPFATRLHYKLVHRDEKTCLARAAKVVGVTDGVTRNLMEAHPEIPRGKFVTIANGYDKPLERGPLVGAPGGNGEIVIGYTGALYHNPGSRKVRLQQPWRRRPHRFFWHFQRDGDCLYQSPFFFFKALSQLFDRHPEFKTRVRVKFVGTVPDWLPAQVESFGLSRNVELLGPMNHADCINFQKSCDFLLIMSAKSKGGDYSISGKTYEYWGANKPVLGFVPEGDQRTILEKSNTGVVCDPDNTEESAEKMRSLFSKPCVLERDFAFMESYYFRNLAGRFADLFREIGSGARP